MTPRPFPESGQSLRLARTRDAVIERLLAAHPVTATTLTEIGLFPTNKKALKRLDRLVTRQVVQRIGTVHRRHGRPEHVFARSLFKSDQLLHEVELTELCLRLHAGQLLRGPQVTHRDLRPDAELWINGQLYFLELDRGTTGAPQLAVRRFRLYQGSAHIVLWVCPDAGRRDTLRRHAGCIRQTALFTTFAEAVASPHSEVWLDVDGGRAALPRHRQESGTSHTMSKESQEPP